MYRDAKRSLVAASRILRPMYWILSPSPKVLAVQTHTKSLCLVNIPSGNGHVSFERALLTTVRMFGFPASISSIMKIPPFSYASRKLVLTMFPVASLYPKKSDLEVCSFTDIESVRKVEHGRASDCDMGLT